MSLIVSVWKEFSAKECIKHKHTVHIDQTVTRETGTQGKQPALPTAP